jgi:MinD-like ATPase involved in chromosome partitioning or flagellar assembly
MRGAALIRVLIADQVARIVGDLEKLAPYDSDVDVCGVAHNPAAVIEEAWLRQPDVLLLHETFAEPPAEDFAAHLETVSPATRVLLMTSGDPTLAGRWAAGVLGDEADGPALYAAICLAAGVVPHGDADGAATPAEGEPGDAQLTPRRAHPGRATLVVVFSGKGGTGTSLLATSLAVALAGGVDTRAALIDTDLQFGDAAAMLHTDGHPLSIADLAITGEDIDSARLEAVLATGPAGVRVLRSAMSPEVAALISASHLRAMIRAISRAHEFVVIDTASQLDERTLEAFELADRVLLVSSYNMTSVRATKAAIALLEALGVVQERVDVILNHTRPRVSYRRADIEGILGRRALADLPYDPRVDESVDSGSPFLESQPRAELSRRIIALAKTIAGPPATAGNAPPDLPAPPQTPTYRRRFSLGRR